MDVVQGVRLVQAQLGRLDESGVVRPVGQHGHASVVSLRGPQKCRHGQKSKLRTSTACAYARSLCVSSS